MPYPIGKKNDLHRSLFFSHVRRALRPLVSFNSSTSTTPGSSSPAPPLPHLLPLLHVYDTVFHGFFVSLHPDRAPEIARHRAVLAFFKDRLRRLHTTNSPSSSDSAPRLASGPTPTMVPMSFLTSSTKCLARRSKLLRPQPQPCPLLLVSPLPHPQARQSQLSDLTDHLHLTLDLARKADASLHWNIYRSMQLASKMEKLDRWITRWLKHQMPAHVLADVHHLRVEFAIHLDHIECHIQEGTAMMRLAAVGVTEVMEGLEFGGGGGEALSPIKVAVRVWKERVREMLMATGGSVEVVGICGIRGSGKTRLPKGIRRDHQIRSMSLVSFISCF